MKRTLTQILAGLALMVLLASFHHQLSRLKSRDQDLTALRETVRTALDRTEGAENQQAARLGALHELGTRMSELESEVAMATEHGAKTTELQRDLTAARHETDRLKAQLAREASRTAELMDAYHQEVEALGQRNAASFTETQSHLQDLAERFLPDPKQLNAELLAPTVQLNGEDTVGSGTLVYSQHNAATDMVESYVLTSHHVVRNILADSGSALKNGISVTIYTADGQVETRADMIAHNRRIDAAVLKLRTRDTFDRIARALPRQQCGDIHVWERIWAVGCPLGNDPIPTQGEISSVDNPLSGSNYWMINAPTYFGNSGGGVYLADSRELIGVFSKIYTHGKGNPVVVPHMGLCTPMSLIYEWLDREELAFVLESGAAASRLAQASELATPSK